MDMALTPEQTLERATAILDGGSPDLTDLDTADRAAVHAELARLRQDNPARLEQAPELLRVEVKPEPGL
jgi:hypothetical protein